jgi:hypothetical protein
MVTEKPDYLRHRWIGYVLVTLLVPAAVILFFNALVNDNMETKITRTTTLVEALNTACQAYISDNGELPKDLDNRSLYDAVSGNAGGKYYMVFNARDVNSDREMVDSWGTPLRVTRVSATAAKIESAGPDGRFGTADDIANK